MSPSSIDAMGLRAPAPQIHPNWATSLGQTVHMSSQQASWFRCGATTAELFARLLSGLGFKAESKLMKQSRDALLAAADNPTLVPAVKRSSKKLFTRFEQEETDGTWVHREEQIDVLVASCCGVMSHFIDCALTDPDPIEPLKSERGLRRSVLYHAFAVDDTMLKWLSKEVRRQRQMVELTATTSGEFWDLAMIESQPFFDELLAALLPPDGSLSWSAELRVAKQKKIDDHKSPDNEDNWLWWNQAIYGTMLELDDLAAFLKQKTRLDLEPWVSEGPEIYRARAGSGIPVWTVDRPSVDLRYYGKLSVKYNWMIREYGDEGLLLRPSPELEFIRFELMRNRPLRNPPLP
jgi:hypothetical protein